MSNYPDGCNGFMIPDYPRGDDDYDDDDESYIANEPMYDDDGECEDMEYDEANETRSGLVRYIARHL